MSLPSSILELPFHERPLWELLGFAPDREHVDTAYAGFGWATPSRLWLHGGDELRCVERPLLLALHSASAAPPPGDLLLEFELSAEQVVAAPLSTFLARWLPRLPARAPVVLALCNPARVQLPHPASAGDRPMWFASGDVDSWLDADETLDADEPLHADERAAGGRFRLQAERWHQVGPAGVACRLEG